MRGGGREVAEAPTPPFVEGDRQQRASPARMRPEPQEGRDTHAIAVRVSLVEVDEERVDVLLQREATVDGDPGREFSR